MAFDTNDLVLRIRRLVSCSIRLGYRSACDHPGTLLSGILLLFLYELCPSSVFAFLVSSSPVFALTALLLGVLLSYGESSVPCWDGGEMLEDHGILSKSSIAVAGCSVSGVVENVALEDRSERIENGKYNGGLHVSGGSADDRVCDAPCEEKMVTHIAADDAVLHREAAYVEEERTPNGNFHGTKCGEKNVSFVADDTVLGAEWCSKYPKTNAAVERAEEIGEKAELQELDRSYIGSGNNGVHSQYQMGELMRACWQPVMRQDTPCYDSESDLSDDSSSPDAAMTDIIPMLEELHPLIDLGTGHPSLASRDKFNSSSDDDEDDLEEEGVSSETSDEEGEERQEDDGNDWKDVTELNSFDMEENSKMENVMELQRAKNILKFDLDKKLMDLQATTTTRMLKDASSFHVQVPSISTLRQNTFDPSKHSEEIELPQIPGSGPSLLLPRRNQLDLQFDRIVDHRSRFEETWTPRTRFRSSAQNRKHRNSNGQQHSTYLQHHTSVTMENSEVSGKDSCDDGHSDNDTEQEGKLFGSLEAHLGEEMKILSAAISDVCVLGEVNNHGTDEGSKNASVRDDTSSLPGANNNSELCIVEAGSMGEVNSLFKCRMEEVLARSVSEPSVGQPLEVKPEGGLSVSLSSDSWMHANEASSVEVLTFQFALFDEEAATCAASASNNHPDELIQGRSSEALNGHRSRVPTELDGCNVLLTEGDQKTADMSQEPNELLNAGLLVQEAIPVEEMNSPFEQLKEDGRSDMNMPRDCEFEVDPVELNTGPRVIDADTHG